MSFTKDITEVFKLRAAFLAGAGATLGSAACGHNAGKAFPAGFCVFLLSAGAGAFNNYQDRSFDALSERTRGRALPTGRLNASSVPLPAFLLTVLGASGLFFTGGSPAAPFLGLLATLLYNGVYTPLKRKSPLALVPGILSGSLPPLIGWLAAGGGMGMSALYLTALFTAWQLPHLLLQGLAAGQGESRALRWLTAACVACFASATLFMKYFGLLRGGPAFYFALANALVLPAVFTPALVVKRKTPIRGLSDGFNASFLTLILIAAADSLA